VISIKNLSKTYMTRGNAGPTVAIQDLSLEVEQNEFVTVLGPSGCGKTTLLKIVAGLVPYDEGELLVDGRQVSGPGPERAMVFQNFALLPWATVLDNVALGLECRGVGKAERRDRARELIKTIGLEGFESSLPNHLSGGMQQRVGLARALAIEPKVLLMDEPFSALDEQTRRFMQEELLRTCEKFQITVFFVTHSIEEAVFLGDRVVLLSPRPGRLHGVHEVPIARPRVDVESNPLFGQLTTQLWHEIRGMGSPQADSSAVTSAHIRGG
jgi:NitT/TauT family transport system ATP-binding protein